MRLNQNIHIAFLIFMMAFPGITADGQGYAANSVLKGGSWYRIKVNKEGVVRINYSDLAKIGLTSGLPVVWGNNHGLLSYYNDDPGPDDLEPVHIHIELGLDGIFNSGDYLLFYAESPHRWEHRENSDYDFKRHFYSDTAHYFITTGTSTAAIETDNTPLTPNQVTPYCDHLFIHEIETSNILKSGREWYQPVASTMPLGIYPGFNDYTLEPGEEVKITTRVLARSSLLTLFRLNNGGSTISSIQVPEVNILNTAGTYARIVENSVTVANSGIAPGLSLEYHNNGDNSARGWLDFLKISMRVRLEYRDKPVVIRDYKTADTGNITRFDINSDYNNLIIWDVTDHQNPLNIPVSYNAGVASFVAATDSLKKFVAFRLPDAISPISVDGPVGNQDLHQEGEYDMIIVTHPLFRIYADRLAAFHLKNDGLVSKVVTPAQIYNEFSGGIPDISAIRNYVRMVYTRNREGTRPLKYLLLFGDGSYENRTPPPANPNYIPTYQTLNSNVNVLSFISDDYYGLLDPGEGESTGYIDIGIGRLPVWDTTQAMILINKIEDYADPSTMGPWRNTICMVADDEDNNAHINDAESLSNLIKSVAPAFNVEKVYLDSYRQETSISGDSYPAATAAIDDKIEAGCLIFNYLGHGNELGLAHERVVRTENINSWRNGGRLPVFITASCEFSRFDDVEIDPGSGKITPKPSAGEMVLLNPDGGGIALLTTTRIVYSAPNYILNNKIYQYAFDKDENNEGLTLGQIVKLAKNNSGSGDNKRNFTLLGDPALKLAYPWHGTVVTDSVNGVHLSLFNDTIRALSKIRFSGHIEDNNGVIPDDVNGTVYPALFDKAYKITTLANDGGQPYEYSLQDRMLFKGKAEVKDGIFTFTLIIPRDIDFTYGEGKISYFALAGSKDYAGYNTDIIIGGFSNVVSTDTSGPEIRLFLNDTLFREGGITDNRPVLLALISDEGGINTTGTGIGHDIVCYTDNDRTNSAVLNNYYENDFGSYISGSLTYPLGYLDKGKHSVTLKAWDNFNNSSSETLVFFVESGGSFILDKLINWPNPVAGETRISVEHNRPEVEMSIDITIYTSGGAVVKRIIDRQVTAGYRLNPIVWDGNNQSGSRVGRGVYIYTVTITTGEGEVGRISGRMVIL